ncbi:MAG: hypothetical protein ACI4F9_06245 [Lachnospiraceae bacterium]
MRRQKYFYTVILFCFLLSIVFSGCSKKETELEENQSENITSSQEETSSQEIASNQDNIEDSTKEKEITNLNQGINGEIFINLEKLEKLASQYKQENIENTDTASLLAAKYLRCGNKNYQSMDWNILAGYPDEGFETYVLNNAPESLISFRDNAVVIDPATGREIEFSHLMASVNLALRQEQIESDVEEPYVDYGSWGGDLLQLCKEIKQEGIDSSSWKEEMINRIGNENSAFNRNDLYADLDACNMKLFFDKGMSLSEAFYRYYYDVLEKSETTRYQYFYENYFEGIEGEDALAQKMKSILQKEDSMISQVLITTENLDITEDAYLISVACEAFAQKIIQNN